MTTKPSTICKASPALRPDALHQSVTEPDFPIPGISAYEGISRAEVEDYQVALLPFQPAQNSTGKSLPDNIDGYRLLVLPFTWKELFTQEYTGKKERNNAREGTVFEFGDIRVDLLSIEITSSGRRVQLSAMEFKVLKFFLANPNRVISRDELLNEVWGYNNYPCTRTVDNHLLRLRRKLEPNAARPVYFRTVHGFGYRFTP